MTQLSSKFSPDIGKFLSEQGLDICKKALYSGEDREKAIERVYICDSVISHVDLQLKKKAEKEIKDKLKGVPTADMSERKRKTGKRRKKQRKKRPSKQKRKKNDNKKSSRKRKARQFHPHPLQLLHQRRAFSRRITYKRVKKVQPCRVRRVHPWQPVVELFKIRALAMSYVCRWTST